MEKLLSTFLMVAVGKLLTEYMWSPQHFKYIYFLNKNSLPCQLPPCGAPFSGPSSLLEPPALTQGVLPGWMGPFSLHALTLVAGSAT